MHPESTADVRYIDSIPARVLLPATTVRDRQAVGQVKKAAETARVIDGLRKGIGCTGSLRDQVHVVNPLMLRRLRSATVCAVLATLSACASGRAAERLASRPPSVPLVLTTPPAIRYPEMLRSANVEGEVIADVFVDSTGLMSWGKSRVVRSSHDLFTASVRNAYRAARWTPAIEDGAPASSVTRDTVTFHLNADSAEHCAVATSHHAYICAVASVFRRPAPMSGAERDRLLATLSEGRERWRRARPARYRIEVTENAGMVYYTGPRSRVVVEVAGDRIVKVRRTPVNTPQGVNWLNLTVEKLFDYAENHVRTTSARVDALDLDPKLGYVLRLHSDVPYTSDSETDIRVQAFTPVP